MLIMDKDLRYKWIYTIHTIIFEQNDLEESTSEDYNYIYSTKYFYATKKNYRY